VFINICKFTSILLHVIFVIACFYSLSGFAYCNSFVFVVSLQCRNVVLYCIVHYDKDIWRTLWREMSGEIVTGEREPLLGVVQSYDVCIDSASPGSVDHSICVPEIINTPVTNSHLQVFKRRWYVLVLFSLIYMTQSAIWNTWGPLTQSAEIAFGWSLDDIALLANWGCIMYVSSMVFFSWLMDVKGTLFSLIRICYFFLFVKNSHSALIPSVL